MGRIREKTRPTRYQDLIYTQNNSIVWHRHIDPWDRIELNNSQAVWKIDTWPDVTNQWLMNNPVNKWCWDS